MRFLRRGASHDWSQRQSLPLLEGDLSWLGRRRLELHAEQCPECSLGIRALRSLVRLMHGAAGQPREVAPDSIFDRVRAQAAHSTTDSESGN